MDEKRTPKNGEIVGVEVWCENCQSNHFVPFSVIINAAMQGEEKLTGFFCGQLIAFVTAVALALEITSSRPNLGIVKTYNQDDLNKLFGSDNDLFRNLSI